MIELTFKGDSLGEVFDAMREVLSGGNPKTEVLISKKEIDAPKKEEPVEEEVVEEEVVEETKPSLTMDEIRKMASAKAREGKSNEVKAILAEMNVEKVKQIPQESFEEFVEKLEAL